MPHVIEHAKTGRAKCRGCGQPIAAGALRLGERVPNPFSDDGGETTLWYHVACAAFMRPEAFLETIAVAAEPIDGRDMLEHEAGLGVAHRRLPRATVAERASTGRATCRHCKTPIEKGSWRIALMYYDEGRFAPSGFIHIGCVRDYLETAEIFGRLKHFSPELSDADLADIRAALGS
jgi:ribosomal protein L37AE/L43A